MIQSRVRHLEEETVRNAVANASMLTGDISDAAAVTIASWWQSPGGVGSTLASLASGCAVDLTELLEDVHATRTWARTHGGTTQADERAFDCLSSWAINRELES